MRPTQEEPPLLVKAAGGEVIPFESSVTKSQHSTVRNDELLTAATSDPDLWQKVAKGVRWRRCVTHGLVVRPNLTEQEFKDGTVHIRATCPACDCFLGHVGRQAKPRKKRTMSPAKLAAKMIAIAPDQGPLWAAAAPDATWKPCKEHGPITKPLLFVQVTKGARHHLRAWCPSCGNSLGFVRRKMIYADDEPADMKRVYRRFLDEARASGCKLGQAYFRFKARYGCDPDPAWAN